MDRATILAWHPTAVATLFAMAAITFVVLRILKAPYGRHAEAGWGPTMPPRLGWVIMESPSVFWFAWLWWVTAESPGVVAWTLLLLWQSHYLWRTFVFPFRMRVRPDDRMPVLVCALAFCFNLLNGLCNAPVAAGAVGDLGAGWLSDPRFLVGVVLFVGGTALNRWADEVLRNLRKPGETGYKIPRGGLYAWVSCPNYLGELVEWLGWAIATWSTAGLGFFVYTAANLVPRGLDHHAWYREKFPDYPKGRKAVVPYLL